MLPICSIRFPSGASQLPAAVSAAPTISAIAVPAASTAAPAAAPSATPAAPATSKATPAAPTSATTTFTRRPCFVHDDIATHEIVAVQSLYGALGLVVAIDLDKSEPAWLTRETVAHQGDIRHGDSRLRK